MKLIFRIKETIKDCLDSKRERRIDVNLISDIKWKIRDYLFDRRCKIIEKKFLKDRKRLEKIEERDYIGQSPWRIVGKKGEQMDYKGLDIFFNFEATPWAWYFFHKGKEYSCVIPQHISDKTAMEIRKLVRRNVMDTIRAILKREAK